MKALLLKDLYVLLRQARLFLLLIVFLMRRRRPCLDTFFLPLQTFYTAFLCLWGTCVTLLDQFGGNSLSVFTYVTLSAAALTVLQPWQSALIFTGNCLFLNLLLPYTPAGPDNFYTIAGVVAYALFLAIPAGINLTEELKWHILRSKI